MDNNEDFNYWTFKILFVRCFKVLINSHYLLLIRIYNRAFIFEITLIHVSVGTTKQKIKYSFSSFTKALI